MTSQSLLISHALKNRINIIKGDFIVLLKVKLHSSEYHKWESI